MFTLIVDTSMKTVLNKENWIYSMHIYFLNENTYLAKNAEQDGVVQLSLILVF